MHRPVASEFINKINLKNNYSAYFFLFGKGNIIITMNLQVNYE